jgi:hypothetical protein
MKAQASAELLIILSVVLVVFTIVFAIAQNEFDASKMNMDAVKARSALRALMDAADYVYAQGEGASTRVFVAVPDRIESSDVSGTHLIYRMDFAGRKQDILEVGRACVSGYIPTDAGGQWVTLTSSGGCVRIGERDIVPSQESLSFNLYSGEQQQLVLTLTNYGNETKVVGVSVLGSDMLALGSSQVILDPSVPTNVTVTASATAGAAAGVHYAQLFLNSTATQMIDVTIQIERRSSLDMYPASWNPTIQAGGSGTQSMVLCNSGEATIYGIVLTVSGTPGTWTTYPDGTGIPTLKHGDCSTKRIMLSPPSSEASGEYDGTIRAADSGTVSAEASLTATVTPAPTTSTTSTSSTTTLPPFNQYCVSADEGHSLTLACPQGNTIIAVEMSNYISQASPITCPLGGTDPSCPGTCTQATSPCIGMQSCTIQATNAACGGDPCYGTLKKLVVVYDCAVASSATTTTSTTIPGQPPQYCVLVNEGYSALLVCSAPDAISRIVRSDYISANSQLSCQIGGTDPLCPGSCAQETNACLGQETCPVDASNTACGGDPCVGIYKKLIVAYECTASSSTTSTTSTTTTTLLPPGSACQGPALCASGFCVDGVCCNSACAGTCSRCDMLSSPGTCAFTPAGQDNDNECPGAFGTCTGTACDGAGHCQFAAGGEGICPVCTRCTGSAYTCQYMAAHSQDNEGLTLCSGTCKECNGAGACTNQVNGQDYFSQCGDSCGVCNGAGVCANAPAGEGSCTACKRCTGSSQTCQNIAAHAQDAEGASTCTGTCQECNVGACTNQTNGRDYFNHCPGAFGTCAGANCNGAGACQFAGAGEGGCSVCTRCTGSAYACQNVADHSQDTQGVNLCRSTCMECLSGVCVTEAAGSDYFNQCPGAFGTCAGANCGGSGACQFVPSGEGGCATCRRCNGISYACENILAHNQDAEGVRLCNSTCRECSGAGACMNQAGGQDYFNQCPGAYGACAADLCNGAGACSYLPAGEGLCPACQRCIGTRFTCSNIANHNQDAEGVNFCIALCKECNGAGACTNQGSGRDYFNQCPGPINCNGAGACS